MSNIRRQAWFPALVAAIVLVAGACGEEDLGTSGSSGRGGTVDVTGSSTVAPISTRVAELYETSGGSGTVNVDGPGTGDGFVAFCDGDADITGASRPIKPEEVEACAANGVEFIELQIAYDGLSVITNADNEVECLTFADLYALVGPESQGFDTWSDAQDLAAELGSTTELPEGSLDISGPGEESGTYDSFIEIALSDIAEQRLEEGKVSEDQVKTTRPDYQSSSDDNVILQGVEGSKTSLGWVGLAYAEESAGKVREVPIAAEVGGECVAPSAQTVSDGSYPIARPLFIYVNAASAEDKEAVVDYVDFYLSDEGLAAVSAVGYVDLPAEEVEATRSTWEARTTGSKVEG